MPEHYLVITSWPDLEGARSQAHRWLQKKLAANINILPQMESIYRWKGGIRNGSEHQVLIKTCADRLDALRAEINATHPYPVAEILHFKIDSGEPKYLNWITQATR